MIYKQGCLNFVTLYNKEFSVMARHACRTISNSKIFVNAFEFSLPARGFRSTSWYYFCRKKIELLKKLLEIAPKDEFVGVFDCDIQFFDNNQLIKLWNQIKASDFTYVGLTEGCQDSLCGEKLFYDSQKMPIETNTGFILIKNNKEAIDFLNHVLKKNFKQKNFADQTAVNESFHEIKISRALLNPCLFRNGCCGPRQEATLHHANCTSNYVQKINQMNSFRKNLNLSPVRWGEDSYGVNCQIFKYKINKIY